jgi:tRNA (cmo5U34)-methyltransferase
MKSVQSDQVREHFANDWTDYDQRIKSVIPFYDQAFSTLLDVIAASYPRPKQILDLGVGTGNLARQLLATFPEAHLTGIDLVEEFIDTARLKLSDFGKRSALQCMDVIDFEFKDPYDVVVTSFVFHHLEDDTKRAMYARVFRALSPGVVFLMLILLMRGPVFTVTYLIGYA